MKLKNYEVLALSKSLNGITKQPLKMGTARKVIVIKTEADKAALSTEEQRLKLVQKYGAEGEDKVVSVTEANREKFFEDYKKILEKTVDLNCEPLPSDSFDHLEVSAEDVAGLLPILKD